MWQRFSNGRRSTLKPSRPPRAGIRRFRREILAIVATSLLSLNLAWAAPEPKWCSAPAELNAAALERLEPMLQSQPQPMERLFLAGYLPHQGRHDESAQAVRELQTLREAALAWRAGAGDAYYELAKR